MPLESLALVQATTRTVVGDGTTTQFWEDRWVNGARISEIAPALYNRIPSRTRKSRMVSDALSNGTWASDVGRNLTLPELEEFLRLWTSLAEFELSEGVEDKVQLSWERNGSYSVRSAYAAKFMGRKLSPTAAFTWKSRAPLRCRFFSWLAIRNHYWTSDRLAHRGLPHQDTCPFCNQHDETIQHLLIGCVSARQVWQWCTTLAGRAEYLTYPYQMRPWADGAHDRKKAWSTVSPRGHYAC